MNPRVVAAKAVSATHVEVLFDSGETGLFDVTPYLEYPVFAPLRNRALFQAARAEHGTVVWSDELDLCPDTVYLESTRPCPAGR